MVKKNIINMVLKKEKALIQLLWIGMGSIGMFFAGLTSAHIVRKAEGNWIEFIFPNWFLLSTITILLSSLLLIIALKKIKNNASAYKLTIWTFVLGLLFCFLQVNGWKELIEQGIYLTGQGSNAAGSFLYVITLTHLLHLVGGLIALFVISINAKKEKYNAKNYLGFKLGSTYWHFLGILWIYLFFFLKYS